LGTIENFVLVNATFSRHFASIIMIQSLAWR